MSRKSFIEEIINDEYNVSSLPDKKTLKNAETIKKQYLKWIAKFNKCNSVESLNDVAKKYNKSKVSEYINLPQLLLNYVFLDICNKKRFELVMKMLSIGDIYVNEDIFVKSLCYLCNPDDILNLFNYSMGTKTTKKKHKKDFEKYVSILKNGSIQYLKKGYYDNRINLFVEKIKGYNTETGCFDRTEICLYFNSFEAFVEYRKGDLTHCDFSESQVLNLSDCKTDTTTILPMEMETDLRYTVQKYYQNGIFYVKQKWENQNNHIVKECNNSFRYFFDFVAFLNRDLSQANLLLCDGLKNLPDNKQINFTDAMLGSQVCKNLNISFEPFVLNKATLKVFDIIEENEKEQLLLPINDNAEIMQFSQDHLLRGEGRQENYKIGYISDIHIIHKIQQADCKSLNDVKYVIFDIAEKISMQENSLLLICGDVSSDFEIFSLFIQYLYRLTHRRCKIVFVLGNHELWSFAGSSIDDIVLKYRNLLNEYNMYFLHNDLLYYKNNQISVIPYESLCILTNKEIMDTVRGSSYLILGSMGFAGYNNKFNANNGIYGLTLNRDREIYETTKFQSLYCRLCPILKNFNTIIMTHMPKSDWDDNLNYENNFVYVSGHTHKLHFYDDGNTRIYADNQIGYYKKSIDIKTFFIDKYYDYFVDYQDGIYEITKEQYCDFYKGTNIRMSFSMEVQCLYMLKKDNYYCFICKTQAGNLAILNGGMSKKIKEKEIEYYYNHMHLMIASMKSPLDKYTEYQKRIANEVKKIGGSGSIHGCIIDIDFLNHIYVNPIDMSLTGYWAKDIIYKKVYPNIPSLLQSNCPRIYVQYTKMIETSKNISLLQNTVSNNIEVLPQTYLDTDIYRASREIKKMQRLYSNILTFWNEDILDIKNQIE